MGFLLALQFGALGAFAFYFAAFLAALLVIIFVHEFGHFIVARWCGVKIEVFSIGFGKELLGFNDRHGTRWKLCAIPVGGYVKFEGDANAASMPSHDAKLAASPTSLQAQPVAQRMAIVAAGPMANFLLAIVIFTGAYMAIGFEYMRPIIDEVQTGSAAQVAGLKPGDIVKSIDGKEITHFDSIRESVFLRPDEKLVFVIERQGTVMTVDVMPKGVVKKDSFGGSMKIGQVGVIHTKRADEPLVRLYAPHEAVAKAVERTWFNIATTMRFLAKVVTGNQSVKQIGGAVSIGKHAGDAAAGGVINFVYFIGLLSVSIGLVNLFPIPMLDGGHLVFYAIEALRGKPLSLGAQEWGFRIGFSCVVMLMLLGLFNDYGRVINVVFGT